MHAPGRCIVARACMLGVWQVCYTESRALTAAELSRHPPESVAKHRHSTR